MHPGACRSHLGVLISNKLEFFLSKCGIESSGVGILVKII